MTEDAVGGEAGELQFEKVDVPSEKRALCARCTRAINDEYYEIRGAMICPQCNKLLGGKSSAGSGTFLRAWGYGLGAAFVGTLIWIAVQKLTGMNLGIVAIGVGYLVGMAVRTGSGGRGGRRNQLLAIALTYFSITSSYVPDVITSLRDHSAAHPEEKEKADAAPKHGLLFSAVVATVVIFGFAMAVPFLAKDLIGFLIIGIALYEAWKINVAPPISGPFRIATPPA